MKCWSSWFNWSDGVVLEQLVKDLRGINNLEDLQWIFKKTDGITEDILKQNLKKALTDSKGIEALQQIPKEKLTTLFNLEKEGILNANNIEKFIDNNFNTIFKVVE